MKDDYYGHIAEYATDDAESEVAEDARIALKDPTLEPDSVTEDLYRDFTLVVDTIKKFGAETGEGIIHEGEGSDHVCDQQVAGGSPV